MHIRLSSLTLEYDLIKNLIIIYNIISLYIYDIINLCNI